MKTVPYSSGLSREAAKDAEAAPSILEQISTRWSTVTDPMQFVLRYGPALRKYLFALIPDPHDAEDVAQDFLTRVVRKAGPAPEKVHRGRFRDYLKASLRNAAFDHFRKKGSAARNLAAFEATLQAAVEEPADAAWNAEWRAILLNRCWERLETGERRSVDNFGHTALRLTVDFPAEDSARLAERVSAKKGKPVTVIAFRKQLSRARKQFATFLVEEVRQTLRTADRDALLEELGDLRLMEYIRPVLGK